ncbi:uncharacterized protein LOC21386634 isoform X2 [Morus notabilis]|uniref:uncharacterized protein LOC21386634 isoform X2 n=1 Tax=Morus notabilis TaxID=981085 RepID=UPI000CED6BD0|nr:uncharacterized protein LOC21386634 isoform X2 [Morus notabilis]
MASAAGVDSSPYPSDHHCLLRPDSLPLVDLRLLSQSDLFSLSLSSSSQPLGRCDDDVLIPKIDRSVFNESAGSRKQTYSRLRLAPRNSQFPSSSARQTPEPLAQESFQVIALLKQLFSSGTNDELVPIRVHYNDAAHEPSSSVAVRNVPIHVVLPNSAPEKRKRGRPRKNATEGLGTLNWENPLPVSYGSVGEVAPAPVSSNSAFSVGSVKHKRGRPRKNTITETGRSVAGMVSVPISSNAAFHRSAMDIISVPVPLNAVSYDSAKDVVPIPVSFNSPFFDDAKKLKPGRPRKNRDTVLCCNVTGCIPVPVSSNAVPNDSLAKIVSVPVSSATDIASSGGQVKRKRGRPRKNETRYVRVVKGDDKAGTFFDDAKERVEKKEELVNVNRNGCVVDLVALGHSEDPFSAELRQKTEGMRTEAELLGFLGGLEGEWGSWRRKKKIVPASELSDTLPRGWKIQISLKRREGHASLFCRRYLSPNGQQFLSCKEASSYLLASCGVQDAGQSNPGLADGNVQIANKVGSYDANLFFEDAKNTDVPVSCSRVPITFVSTDHEEQAILLETRNLDKGQIGANEEKPSDRQRADTATRIDGESGGVVLFSHAEKVKIGSNDENCQEFCEKLGKVCIMTNKNELGELDEVIEVGEIASSNKKNGNSFQFSDGTSMVTCAPSSSSVEELKIDVEPGTGLPASSSDEKICSPAAHQSTRRVEDRNDESTSSHCGSGIGEECDPVKDVNRSLTYVMMGSDRDRSSELGLCSSSIDERSCLVSNDANNVSSSTLYESKFMNKKIISSGSNRITSDVEAVNRTELDRSSGRSLRVPPSNEQNFITEIDSDIPNFKMEEPWDDRGFESNVFTSFDDDDNGNKSSFVAVDMSKVDDIRICKGSSEFSVAFGGKDTGTHANPVSCMEQVGNVGGSHVSSSCESKYALRDSSATDRQMEEVQQDEGSLDFHVLGQSNYSQSCNFIDSVNDIFSSSLEESGSKEMKSFWNNEVLHAFDSIDTGTDTNAGKTTIKGSSSEGSSPVISRSGQTFPNTNNLSGIYRRKVEELKLKRCSDIGLIHVPDDMKRASTNALWEQPKQEDTNKTRNNELMTGSVNNSQTYGDFTPELIWGTDEQNFQPSRLVDTSSAPMQLSGCFANFNIMSEKDAYGDLNVNERFEGISGFEGLGLGSTKQSQYDFLTAQGTLNSNESKCLSHAEIKQGFDPSFWLTNESLTLFPKVAAENQTVTICIWCRKEFYHQGVSSETKSGSVGLMCATCQGKFSG